MRIDYQFENTTLLFKEKMTLRKVYAFRSLDARSVYHFQILYDADFLEYDRGSEVDQFNKPILLHTVHITDKCKRFFKWQKSRILGSVLLPIAISVATYLAIHVIETWLMPILQ